MYVKDGNSAGTVEKASFQANRGYSRSRYRQILLIIYAVSFYLREHWSTHAPEARVPGYSCTQHASSTLHSNITYI